MYNSYFSKQIQTKTIQDIEHNFYGDNILEFNLNIVKGESYMEAVIILIVLLSFFIHTDEEDRH